MTNVGRHIIKHKLVRQHRELRYQYELDRLMNGRAEPGDVTLRFKKLKEVR